MRLNPHFLIASMAVIGSACNGQAASTNQSPSNKVQEAGSESTLGSCPDLSGSYRVISNATFPTIYTIVQTDCSSVQVNISCRDGESYSPESSGLFLDQYTSNDYPSAASLKVSGKPEVVQWSHTAGTTTAFETVTANFVGNKLSITENVSLSDNPQENHSTKLNIYQTKNPCNTLGNGANYLVIESSKLDQNDISDCKYWEQADSMPDVRTASVFSPISGGIYKTVNGSVFKQVQGPGQFGLSWEDPSGVIWSSYQGDYTNNLGKKSISVNGVRMTEAEAICNQLGGKLPSYTDYRNLLEYFGVVAYGDPPDWHIPPQGLNDWFKIFPDMQTATGFYWTSSQCRFSNTGDCEDLWNHDALSGMYGSIIDDMPAYWRADPKEAILSVRCVSN